MTEPRHSLSNTLVQAIGDYLITRPYKEVAGLISALQQEVQTSMKTNGVQPADSDERTTGDLQ